MTKNELAPHLRRFQIFEEFKGMSKSTFGSAERLNVEKAADFNSADFYVELSATFKFLI
jgi:hypothetical protein